MRYLSPFLVTDLQKKMVFLGGPRQCGKTTVAQELLHARYEDSGQYLNWDYDEDQRNILDLKWSDREKLLIFDELHKYPRWKTFIKGLFDKQKSLHHFLVTGSARLDLHKKGGDSLLGRYHYWRLHPFDIAEHPASIPDAEALQRLLTLGGFPEPFLSGDEREAKRWRKERFTKIIKEDVRDLERINEIQLFSLFAQLLKSRVQGEVVFSNLAGDLKVSEKTLVRWLEILEKMYLLFVVRPYSTNIARAIQKTPKVYFYDNSDVEGDESARFENLVATHLLKRIQFIEDYEGDDCSLAYIRDKSKREVDFVVTRNKVIEYLIEVKLSDETLSPHLVYYSDKLRPKKTVQIVKNCKRPFNRSGIEVTDPIRFFKNWVPWRV